MRKTPRRLRLALAGLLSLQAAAPAAAFLDPNLVLGLVGQITQRRKAREARRQQARELEATDARLEAIHRALRGEGRGSRKAGLEALLALSRDLRDGTARIRSREPLDALLAVMDAAPSPGVRRYAAEVRRNLDLARSLEPRSERLAAVLSRHRPPGI